jgi:hypothetical protein
VPSPNGDRLLFTTTPKPATPYPADGCPPARPPGLPRTPSRALRPRARGLRRRATVPSRGRRWHCRPGPFRSSPRTASPRPRQLPGSQPLHRHVCDSKQMSLRRPTSCKEQCLRCKAWHWAAPLACTPPPAQSDSEALAPPRECRGGGGPEQTRSRSRGKSRLTQDCGRAVLGRGPEVRGPLSGDLLGPPVSSRLYHPLFFCHQASSSETFTGMPALSFKQRAGDCA